MVLHGAALAVIVAGVAVNVVRPDAPVLGALADPSRWFDAAHLARADAYRAPRYMAALAALVVRLGIVLAVALTPLGHRLVGRLVDGIGPHRPARAAAGVVVVVLVGADVALLPVAFWSGYLHEGAFGFRTQSMAGWARDWLVGHLPMWVIAATVTAAGYALVRRLPRSWPPVAGLFAAALVAIGVFAAPAVLEPLRFTFVPLQDAAVEQAVTRVVDAGATRVDNLLVADASRRTTKHNAYVSGLGATRRVVLYDTLVADRPADEVAVIVAHELGHDRNGDLSRGALLGGAGAAAGAYLLAWLARRRTRRGRQRGQADPRGAAAALAAVLVLSTVTLPLQQALSRRSERAADAASLELTNDPDAYLRMHMSLARTNLSHPAPPTWVRLLWGSHPSVVERMTRGELSRNGPPSAPLAAASLSPI
ncbi:MAG: M48 family metalloprotease, partial [Egibacteraceae bacterium]